VSGKLIGVGVGPGDPDLVTLKAVRALAAADVVAHFAKAGNAGNGRTTAAVHLKPGVAELPLLYPVTTEIPKCEPRYKQLIGDFYDAAAASVAERLDAGLTVAVICEGDPLFYGSFMHLHVRLAERRADGGAGHAARGGARAPLRRGRCRRGDEARPQSAEGAPRAGTGTAAR
jgi:precorrin-2/cobalt-factor-2 C20-methyltransferase